VKRILLFILIGSGAAVLFVLALAAAALWWYQPEVTITSFPPPKPVSGAAVYYNRAFAAMPDKSKLTEGEKKLLQLKSDQPLDAGAATKLLEKYEQSFKLLKQGADEPECEWGLDLNRGPGIPCPQAGGLEMVKLLCNLHARLCLERGNASAAVDDLLLAFRVGPHFEQPEFLINSLIRSATDSIAINFVLRHLSEFDAVSLQKLSGGIATAKPPLPLHLAVANEGKINNVYFNNVIAKAAGKPGWNWLAPFFKEEKKKPEIREQPSVQTITVNHGIAIKYLVYSVRRYEKKRVELERLMRLPYAEGKPQLQEFDREMKRNRWINGPFALALPALSGAWFKEVHTEALRAILRVALSAQIRDPGSVRGELVKLHDPYDDGPLELRDAPDGVEVKMKAPPEMKPSTLMVGSAKK